MKIKILLISSIAMTASGCAPMISSAMNVGTTSDDVYNKTAAYFGTTKDQIEFKNVQKHTLRTTYNAVYKETFYNCHVYYGAVKCAKPGEE